MYTHTQTHTHRHTHTQTHTKTHTQTHRHTYIIYCYVRDTVSFNFIYCHYPVCAHSVTSLT